MDLRFESLRDSSVTGILQFSFLVKTFPTLSSSAFLSTLGESRKNKYTTRNPYKLALLVPVESINALRSTY